MSVEEAVALREAVHRLGDLLFESRYTGSPESDTFTEFWKVVGIGYVLSRHTDDALPGRIAAMTQDIIDIHASLAGVLTLRGRCAQPPQRSDARPLFEAIDRLGELMLEASLDGPVLPASTLDSMWTVIGTTYITTRHPDEAPFPLPGMLAGVDRAHAHLAEAVRRRREGGGSAQ